MPTPPDLLVKLCHIQQFEDKLVILSIIAPKKEIEYNGTETNKDVLGAFIPAKATWLYVKLICGSIPCRFSMEVEFP